MLSRLWHWLFPSTRFPLIVEVTQEHIDRGARKNRRDLLKYAMLTPAAMGLLELPSPAAPVTSQLKQLAVKSTLIHMGTGELLDPYDRSWRPNFLGPDGGPGPEFEALSIWVDAQGKVRWPHLYRWQVWPWVPGENGDDNLVLEPVRWSFPNHPKTEQLTNGWKIWRAKPADPDSLVEEVALYVKPDGKLDTVFVFSKSVNQQIVAAATISKSGRSIGCSWLISTAHKAERFLPK